MKFAEVRLSNYADGFPLGCENEAGAGLRLETAPAFDEPRFLSHCWEAVSIGRNNSEDLCRTFRRKMKPRRLRPESAPASGVPSYLSHFCNESLLSKVT